MAASKKTATMIVKFVEDHVVDDYRKGTDAEESYKKGQRKSLPIASAKHFINRGKAHPVSKT